MSAGRTRALRLALLLAPLALVAACGGRGPKADPRPTVASLDVVRGAVQLEREGASELTLAHARVEDGASVRTNEIGRATLSLDSGAWALVDRATTLQLGLERLEVTGGRVWIDASQGGATTIDTPTLRLVANDATLAVSVEGEQTRVYVGSGEVAFTAREGGDAASGTVAQGESLRREGSAAPTVAPEAMWDDWTGGLADPARARSRIAEPLGCLYARTSAEVGQAKQPLPIRSHDVRVAIDGDLATTTVTQTFFNARSETVDGEWGIRIPRGAIVAAFEVDRGNGFERATPTAFGVGSSYSLSWASRAFAEARLRYDGPERLAAHISPIAPGSSVAVRLTYTEWLEREGGRRTYVYPMRGDGEPPLLSELVLDVDLTKAGDAARTGLLRAGMGASTENGHVVLRRSDVRPHADFVLELFDDEALEPRGPEAGVVVVGADVGRLEETPPEGREAYALFDVPTEELGELDTPDATAAPPLELVLLLDVSGATESEDFELSRAVIESVLRQLAPEDRVTLRLADLHAWVPEGASEELAPASDATREAILGSIARVSLGGATDLARSLREAATLVAGRPRGAVLYLGDAQPTTGALDATSIRAALDGIDAPPRFFGLAIGEASNIGLLRAALGDGAAQVRDRDDAARAVLAMLTDAAQPTLRGVRVELGAGIERVYPRGDLTLPVGAHLRLVGRLAGELPETILVRGTRDGRPFEASFPTRQVQAQEQGDVRRRWASTRLAELIDQDAGREALVDLGLRFGVVTPWTSLAVGGVTTSTILPVPFFDPDPLSTPFALGGGAAVREGDLGAAVGGWRRRLPPRASEAPASAAESTWVSRVPSVPVVGSLPGDGGLARAASERTLENGERGPRQCFERRAIVRPDLRGDVTVEVTVEPNGAVRQSQIVSSTLGDADVERCVLTEVRGLAFPATEGSSVTISHTFTFQVSERVFGGRRECSEAADQPLEERHRLWQERLTDVYDPGRAIDVFRGALASCELSSWRARRTLLDLVLARFPGLVQRVIIARALSGDPTTRSYLVERILRGVATPEQAAYVRGALALEPRVEWLVFARLWQSATSPEARLRIVRRWLEVAPDDIDLRLRLLSLLEQTRALPEARRLARALRADPLVDAKARTELGEFWLRQGDEGEARRVFSEIVERTPLDPWARQRLGDLYRAHGWYDDAYREYQVLSLLRPDDGAVLLLLARAAAGAGRIDEALRLEQRLGESTDLGDDAGAAASARLFSWLQLAELATSEDARLAEEAKRRMRESGVLRDPPAALIAVTLEHPDDAVELALRHASFDPAAPFEPAELGSVANGVLASRLREREDGDVLLRLTRGDRENLRDEVVSLVVLLAPGTPDERRLVREVRLSSTAREASFTLRPDGTLSP